MWCEWLQFKTRIYCLCQILNLPKHLQNTGNNDVGVIGDTFIEDAALLNPNEKEFDILFTDVKKFYSID